MENTWELGMVVFSPERCLLPAPTCIRCELMSDPASERW